ncbi:unnamed protein product [Effrenium voratum]|uniref:Receptor ligand binding region domain-containing protein n=1 Tax=Effrenium voratum TaxID=2562239 RepID=A0AA36N0V5_9DINO|nr:unnamed protein product [Effrenium voratum]CAJ1435212.1 unnamed protein product [Effrenium voratum]
MMAGSRSLVTIAALVFFFQEYDASAITVTDVQWKAGLIAAGRQSWLIAKMQLEFLMIAKGVNVSKSKANMEESISLFDSEHIMLRDGNGIDIVEAPSQAIVNVLGNVQAKWSPFKIFLKDNVANTSLTVLTTLDDMGSELYGLTQICASRYVDAISGAGANFSGLQVNTANRQSMLVEKMAAEAFLLHFGVHPDTMLNRIVETRTLFVDAHAGILEGLNFVGLEATVNKCISQKMRLVTFFWDEFKGAIDTVIFEELASDNSLNDIVAKIAGLRTEAAAATLAYADPPLSCPTTMTRRQWQMAFDVSTRQLMHAQKACRLFLQAAKGVNTLDSRILFSNSDVSATADLKMMREGSVAADMAAAPTQLVSEKYGVMWLRWLSLGKFMAQNINFVSDEDHRLLQIVEDQGKQFVNYGFEALESIFTECKLKAPEVNCEELKVTGVQRILIQKAAFEAVLIGLERNVTENKKEMIQTIAKFEGSQSGLIHQQPGLPRTLDICILQEMKHVDDLWTPFKSLLLQVHDGDHSVATLLTIWGMTWDAGVDPMSAQLTVAMRAYAEGRGVCTPPLTASRQELESAIKELGFLRAGTQKLAKHFLLSDIGIDSEENMNIWLATLKDLSTQLERIMSGDTSATLPVPIVQVVADRLFDLAEDLADVQSLTVDQYAHASLSLLQKSELAINAYVDAAFDMDPNVPGARSSLASSLLMLLEKMCKEAVLVGLGKGSAAELASSINHYETSQQTLKAAVVIAQMEIVESAWGELQAKIKAIASSGAASDIALSEITSKADAVKAALLPAIDFYSVMTVSIDILVPLPMTGRWSPGPTMKTAAMIARDIINQQQLVLPGFEIKLKFLDDQCDQGHARRAVLEEFAGTDSWVGLAGMACSSVCESLAVVSSSMYIPTVGMDCSGNSLSDTSLFPDFVRLGVKTTSAKNVIIEWAKMFDWGHIAIVSGDPTIYRKEATEYQEAFGNAGIGNSYASLIETDWQGMLLNMGALKDGKRRVVMVFGNETLFRMAVCASAEVGSREGMVWISVGIRSRSWWIVNDEAVLQHSASCTGSKVSSLLQGALFITGLGKSASQAKQPLDCYDGYTSDSLLDHINKSIAQGYNDVTGNSTGAIEHPHVELMGAGADAICVQAKAIQHMLLDHDISELRSPQEAVYNKAVNFIRHELQIEGVSGPVKFSGNDKPGRLGLWQLSGSERIPVGTVYENGTIETGLSEGLRNETWLPAFPEPPSEPFPIGYVVVSIGVFMIFCPVLLGCIVGHNGSISALFAWKPKGSRKQETASV